MHRIQTLPFVRVSNIIIKNNWSFNDILYNTVNARELLPPSLILSSTQKRTAHAKPKSSTVVRFKAVFAEQYDWISEKIYYHAFKKYFYRSKGALLYSRCFDNLDYIRFIKEYNMPDTFYSWFLITELHLWMIMVRLMAAGNEGFHMRTTIVAALWKDVDVRKKQLGVIKDSEVRDQIQELGNQFKAAITGYDEGILESDAILAGAVWRRLLEMNCDDPEKVEKLVKYIRQTLYTLDRLPSKTFLLALPIKWLDYMKPDQK